MKMNKISFCDDSFPRRELRDLHHPTIPEVENCCAESAKTAGTDRFGIWEVINATENYVARIEGVIFWFFENDAIHSSGEHLGMGKVSGGRIAVSITGSTPPPTHVRLTIS